MAAAKKMSQRVELPPSDVSPADLVQAAQEGPHPAVIDPRSILVAAQEALEELKASNGIGTIAQWEFQRSRAHRPNAKAVTHVLRLIEEVVGPYLPVDPEVAARRATTAGVRYNDS